MAALQAAARRDVRIRSEDDMEPATWKVVADAPDLAPEKPVGVAVQWCAGCCPTKFASSSCVGSLADKHLMLVLSRFACAQ